MGTCVGQLNLDVVPFVPTQSDAMSSKTAYELLKGLLPSPEENPSFFATDDTYLREVCRSHSSAQVPVESFLAVVRSRQGDLEFPARLLLRLLESPHLRALSLGRQRQRTRKLPCRVRDSKWRPMSTLVISTTLDKSDSTLEACCHLGIATEHAIYACSFATALCRLCYRASYKMREACRQIFPSSLFGKTDVRTYSFLSYYVLSVWGPRAGII